MSFDHLAPIYRVLEALAFGRTLDVAREQFAGDLEHRDRILLAGEGTGRFLRALTKINPESRIDCLDSSAAMLRRAFDGFDSKSLTRIAFIDADLLQWKPEGSYDAIVTNFFLDCFAESDQQQVVEKLARCASPDSTWLITEFAIPPNRIASLLARAAIGLVYLFFRLTTNISASRLVNYQPALEAGGFTLTKRAPRLGGFVISDVWQRSKDSTLIGVGFSSTGAANPA